jgi:hypothetical protein
MSVLDDAAAALKRAERSLDQVALASQTVTVAQVILVVLVGLILLLLTRKA